MGQLLVFLWLTSLVNIFAQPSQLVFHKITFKDAVINDGKESGESESNDVNKIGNEDNFEKVLVFKRYDLPHDPMSKTQNQRIDYFYKNEENTPEPYMEEEMTESYNQNEVDMKSNIGGAKTNLIKNIYENYYESKEITPDGPVITQSYYDDKGNEILTKTTTTVVEEPVKRNLYENVDSGVYQFETFDAMDALHVSESPVAGAFEGEVFYETPYDNEILYEVLPEPEMYHNGPRGSNVFYNSPSGTEMFHGSNPKTDQSFEHPLKTEIFYEASPKNNERFEGTAMFYDYPSKTEISLQNKKDTELFYPFEASNDNKLDTNMHYESSPEYKESHETIENLDFPFENKESYPSPFKTQVYYKPVPENIASYFNQPGSDVFYESQPEDEKNYQSTYGSDVYTESFNEIEESYKNPFETKVYYETPTGISSFYYESPDLDEDKEIGVNIEDEEMFHIPLEAEIYLESPTENEISSKKEEELFYESPTETQGSQRNKLDTKLLYESTPNPEVQYRTQVESEIFYVTPPPKKKKMRKKVNFESQINEDVFDTTLNNLKVPYDAQLEAKVFNKPFHETLSPYEPSKNKVSISHQTDNFYSNELGTVAFYETPNENEAGNGSLNSIEQFIDIVYKPPPETSLIYESQFETKEELLETKRPEIFFNTTLKEELITKYPRASKLTTQSPIILQGSLVTVSTSTPLKIQLVPTEDPPHMLLPSAPKPPAPPPEIPKTLQAVFKYDSTKTLQPPSIPAIRLKPFSPIDFELMTFNQNQPDANSTKPMARNRPKTDVIHVNYNPEIDDYIAPAPNATLNYAPPNDGFQTTSEIYTPPFRNYSEYAINDTENYNIAKEINGSHHYETQSRVSDNEKSSQKDVEINNFRIPKIVDDPLLNFLAYGTVVGLAINGLGGNPFDVVNLELRNLREKRSHSDG